MKNQIAKWLCTALAVGAIATAGTQAGLPHGDGGRCILPPKKENYSLSGEENAPTSPQEAPTESDASSTV